MKNKILVTALVGLLIFSCKNKEENLSKEKLDSVVPKEEVATKECYEYVQGKDTIQATLTIQTNIVNGDLTYNLFEKDKNTGKISGTLSGDTLFADYKFMSEGVESFRQVAFLKKKETFVECFGDVEEKDGKIVFKDKKALKFSNVVLNKIPCK